MDIVFPYDLFSWSQVAPFLTSHSSTKGAVKALTLCVVISMQVLACLLVLFSPCLPGESLLLSCITPCFLNHNALLFLGVLCFIALAFKLALSVSCSNWFILCLVFSVLAYLSNGYQCCPHWILKIVNQMAKLWGFIESSRGTTEARAERVLVGFQFPPPPHAWSAKA